MLHNVMESEQPPAKASSSFERRCARGIEPNERCVAKHLENSLMFVIALAPRVVQEGGDYMAHRLSQEIRLPKFALKLSFLGRPARAGRHGVSG